MPVLRPRWRIAMGEALHTPVAYAGLGLVAVALVGGHVAGRALLGTTTDTRRQRDRQRRGGSRSLRASGHSRRGRSPPRISIRIWTSAPSRPARRRSDETRAVDPPRGVDRPQRGLRLGRDRALVGRASRAARDRSRSPASVRAAAAGPHAPVAAAAGGSVEPGSRSHAGAGNAFARLAGRASRGHTRPQRGSPARADAHAQGASRRGSGTGPPASAHGEHAAGSSSTVWWRRPCSAKARSSPPNSAGRFNEMEWGPETEGPGRMNERSERP